MDCQSLPDIFECFKKSCLIYYYYDDNDDYNEDLHQRQILCPSNWNPSLFLEVFDQALADSSDQQAGQMADLFSWASSLKVSWSFMDARFVEVIFFHIPNFIEL